MTGQQIYILIKENRSIFNILGVEKYCEIKQGTLSKALDRNQKKFGNSDLLLSLNKIISNTMKVKHKDYHSMLINEKEDLKNLDFYYLGGNTVIQHDLTEGTLPIFKKADVIYSEPAWQRGYELFKNRAQIKDSQNTFKKYLLSIKEAIEELKKPSFIVSGKHMLKTLSPDHVTEIDLHGYKSYLSIWNHKPMSFKDNFACMDKLSEEFPCVLDFSCGYGITAEYFNSWVLSDINKKCVYYVAKKFMNYEDTIS